MMQTPSYVPGAEYSSGIPMLPEDKTHIYHTEFYNKYMTPTNPEPGWGSEHRSNHTKRQMNVRECFARSLGMSERITGLIVQEDTKIDQQNGQMSKKLSAALRKDKVFEEWKIPRGHPIIKLSLPDSLAGQASLGALVQADPIRLQNGADRILQFYCPKDYSGYVAGQNCLLRKLMTDVMRCEHSICYTPSPPRENTYSREQLLKEFERCLRCIKSACHIVIIHGLSEYMKSNEEETKEVINFLIRLAKEEYTGFTSYTKVLFTAPVPAEIEGFEDITVITFEG